MVFSVQLLVILLVSLAVSAIGFRRYVWFFSVGYGFAIAALGLTMLLAFRCDAGAAMLCALLMLYGCRLGGYLAYREWKQASYMQRVGGDIKDHKSISMGAKCAMWVACAVLYVLMVSPIFFRLKNGVASGVSVGFGMAVMVLGAGMELAADIRKSRAKKVDPNRFVDAGLYRIVRCPNYLGELLLWTGVLITGLGGLRGAGQWIMALLGYVGIVYVMFSGARRLELRQNRTYGSDPEYQSYIKTVPILLPGVPLYSVEKYKWLVA